MDSYDHVRFNFSVYIILLYYIHNSTLLQGRVVEIAADTGAVHQRVTPRSSSRVTGARIARVHRRRSDRGRVGVGATINTGGGSSLFLISSRDTSRARGPI